VAKISKADRIKISFTPPDFEEIDQYPAVIRNVSVAGGSTLKYGCQFDEPSDRISHELGTARKLKCQVHAICDLIRT
jgi:hypothetical protein